MPVIYLTKEILELDIIPGGWSSPIGMFADPSVMGTLFARLVQAIPDLTEITMGIDRICVKMRVRVGATQDDADASRDRMKTIVDDVVGTFLTARRSTA